MALMPSEFFDGDTSWTSITLPSTLTGSIRYKKVNDVVTIHFNITSGMPNDTTNWTSFGVLPEDYRPTVADIYEPIYGNDGNSTGLRILRTGGTMSGRINTNTGMFRKIITYVV